MKKYIYDISKLQPGDIILTRNPNNELSQRIMHSTQSEYSHAMFYVGDSSYIEADKRVEARNLQRCIFDDASDTCVLRIKKEYLTPTTIDAAIYYVRFVVGNPYSLIDAIRLESGKTEKSMDNTQICTRLIAKAYSYSGLKIVDNVEMCTIQQLLESKCVVVHKEFCRVANDFDIRFAKSYDVTDDMVKATERLFDSIKGYDNGKIRSMNALLEYVLSHTEEDEEIAGLLEQSGYLSVLNVEEEKNQFNYDKDEFIHFYDEYAYEAAAHSLSINIKEKYRYQQEYYGLIRLFFFVFKSHFLLLLISLYKQLMEQCDRRIKVCYEVMEGPET